MQVLPGGLALLSYPCPHLFLALLSTSKGSDVGVDSASAKKPLRNVGATLQRLHSAASGCHRVHFLLPKQHFVASFATPAPDANSSPLQDKGTAEFEGGRRKEGGVKSAQLLFQARLKAEILLQDWHRSFKNSEFGNKIKEKRKC